MIIQRHIEKKLLALSKKFKVVSVMGPRQSGKTTLVQQAFPEYAYASLEDSDVRHSAEKDPRGFLESLGGKAILDEAQRVPHLFSYIQTHVDKQKKPGQFIITGSSNYLMHQDISQSLAGRVAVLRLLPLSLSELTDANIKANKISALIFKGFYPPVYERKIQPADWYGSYIQTYIERDVRQIQNIGNLSNFQRFLRLCAGRTGQIVNYTAFGNDCGVSHHTIKSWMSILESSFIVYLLQPYFVNFNRRITKTPKLYFYDTGLAAFLLGIKEEKQLTEHYVTGQLMENFVINDLMKNAYNQGLLPDFYYWRDKTGNEIDCLIDKGLSKILVEIKAGKTLNGDFFKGMKQYKSLDKRHRINGWLVYNGEKETRTDFINIINWKNLNKIEF